MSSRFPIVLADSIAEVPVTAWAQGLVVISGSHGGIAAASLALRWPIHGVVRNHAGVGKDGAGISRQAWLARAGIIAATVSAAAARIGRGLDTYHYGVLSHVNGCAAQQGIMVGMRAQDAALLILQERSLGRSNPTYSLESREGMA
jgi:hypothetical protein